MIWKYLNKDIKGALSMRIYGTAGTRVHVIKNNDPLLLVEDQESNKFFIQKTDLSDEPIQTIKQTIQTKAMAKKARR